MLGRGLFKKSWELTWHNSRLSLPWLIFHSLALFFVFFQVVSFLKSISVNTLSSHHSAAHSPQFTHEAQLCLIFVVLTCGHWKLNMWKEKRSAPTAEFHLNHTEKLYVHCPMSNVQCTTPHIHMNEQYRNEKGKEKEKRQSRHGKESWELSIERWALSVSHVSFSLTAPNLISKTTTNPKWIYSSSISSFC